MCAKHDHPHARPAPRRPLQVIDTRGVQTRDTRTFDTLICPRDVAPDIFIDNVQRWLRTQNYAVTTQRQTLLPGVVVVTGFSSREADEACYALNRSMYAHGAEFVDLEEYTRRLLERHHFDVRRLRLEGPWGWLWRVVYDLVPQFGRLP